MVALGDFRDEDPGFRELVPGDAERLAKREPFLAQTQPAPHPQ
jgi:hypothetical protein